MKKDNYYPSGIYMIRNMNNGRVYIGSSENIEKRWKQHQYQLKNNRHQNKNMQKDYNNGDYFIYGLIKDTFPDRRQLLLEENLMINRFIDNNIELYNAAFSWSHGYYLEGTLKDAIINAYCKEHFGKTYNELYLFGSPAKISMYYEIVNDPEHEAEIKKKYEDLMGYYNKFWHQVIRKAI